MLLLVSLLVPAHAAPSVDLGVGIRTGASAGFDEGRHGVRLFGRVHTGGRHALELGAYGRIPTDSLGSLGTTLLLIAAEGGTAAQTVPVTRELATFDLVFQASPWVRPEASGASAWVYGIGGVGVGVMEFSRYGLDEETEAAVLVDGPTLGVVPLGELGLGLDLMFARHVGVRLTALGRLSLGPPLDTFDAPVAASVLSVSSTAAIDFVVAL